MAKTGSGAALRLIAFCFAPKMFTQVDRDILEEAKNKIKIENSFLSARKLHHLYETYKNVLSCLAATSTYNPFWSPLLTIMQSTRSPSPWGPIPFHTFTLLIIINLPRQKCLSQYSWWKRGEGAECRWRSTTGLRTGVYKIAF